MRGSVETFPDSYAQISTAVLLEAYERGPERLRRAVAGLSDVTLRAEPISGKWSILAIALHVADAEVVGAARVRLVLGEEGVLLPGYDQDRWSRSLRYDHADTDRLESGLALFAALRVSTRPLFPVPDSRDWAAAAIHPEHGRVTLRNLLELYADHSERHLEQIVERRRLLESPIDLPPLLHERLY